jgi:hypothetical protein
MAAKKPTLDVKRLSKNEFIAEAERLLGIPPLSDRPRQGEASLRKSITLQGFVTLAQAALGRGGRTWARQRCMHEKKVVASQDSAGWKIWLPSLYGFFKQPLPPLGRPKGPKE